LVLGPAFVLTVLTAYTAHMLPILIGESDAPPIQFLSVAAAGLAFVVVTYVGGVFYGVLAASAAGKTLPVFRLAVHALLALRGGPAALATFLAGPALLFGAACFYWLYWGEQLFVDRLILAEMVIAAFSLWLLTLLAVARLENLGALRPSRVAALVSDLGPRAVLLALAAGALAYAMTRLLLAAVGRLHDDPGAGFLMLGAGWLGALFGGIGFCRWLGVWCRQARA
jgi:hypothetical protein